MKNLMLLAIFSLILIGCNQTKKETTYSNTDEIATKEIALNTTNQEDGYTLMETNCFACHNPETKSHDDIIAPPFVAVKRRYSMQYSTKEEFTNAMIDWVQNPSEEKALMKGAVGEFKVMPKIALETEVLQKIGDYMYDNELEQPVWFKAHFKEMHGDGNGMGKGKGMKNNKN